MNRLPLHDELIEMAALYALGILAKDEADIFDSHLAEGCEACRSELVSFESLVSDLGFGTDPSCRSEPAPATSSHQLVGVPAHHAINQRSPNSVGQQKNT